MLLDNSKKRELMGNNARTFIHKYASVQKIAAQKLNLYRNIIGLDYKTI